MESFCTECGAKQSKPDAPEQFQGQPTSNPPIPKPPRRPMSKVMKILISMAAVLLLAAVGTHLWLTSHYDPIKKLEAMDQAISDNDSTAFIGNFSFEKDAILSEKDYFQYIKDHEWDAAREQFLGVFETQKKSANKLEQPIYSDAGGKLFTVRQKPILFGLYATYTFRAVPSQLTVFTTMDDTELTIADHTEKLQASEPVVLKKVYPGTYNVKGKAESLYGAFSLEKELDVSASEENELNIEFTGSYYPVSTNVWEATLFVDGKDTGKTLD